MHFSKLVQLPYDLKPIASVEGLPKAGRSNHLYLNLEQDAPKSSTTPAGQRFLLYAGTATTPSSLPR